MAAFDQMRKRLFDKRNIEVSPVKNRFESLSVFGHESVRDKFLSDVGGISDHMGKGLGEGSKEKITLHQPSISQCETLRVGKTRFPERGYQFAACSIEGFPVQFDTS